MNSVFEDSGTALLTSYEFGTRYRFGARTPCKQGGADELEDHASENPENVVCAGLQVSLQVQCRRGGVPRRCVFKPRPT